MKHKILLFFFLLIAGSAFGQQMRIQGTVVDEKKNPLAGALISDPETHEVLGATDDDGQYSILIDKNATLLFSSIGCEDQKVKVRGRQQVNVVLATEAVRLEEVQIVAQVKNKVIPEPTDIEVKGNYFHLRTRFRIPNALFKSDTRLIIQPFIYDVTDKRRSELAPFVFDGKQYSVTQERMYGFDISKDPLYTYIEVQTQRKDGELIPYHDSLYVANPKHDFRADVLMSLENYKHILYTDSFVIARGTVNPLRFFEFNLSSANLDDEQHIPKPALQLRNDKGEIELTFEPGKSSINLDDAKNFSEVSQLRQRLRAIEADPNCQLQGFNIMGTASPEGSHETNVSLSKSRMKGATEIILNELSANTRQSLKVKSDAQVETWEAVIALMERDSLGEAEELRRIVKEFPKNPDGQFFKIRNLPYYRSLIVERYLSPLRRVEYQFEYSVFRVLNDQEIRDLYRVNPGDLSRYEYYRLMEMAADEAEQLRLCKESLEKYPRFLYAANRLAVLNLKNRQPDHTVLEPFVSAKAPVEVLINQTVTLLNQQLFTKADSVASLLPVTAQTEEVRAISAVLNGDYEAGLPRARAEGGLNEVLILLAAKRNDEAYEKSKSLGGETAVNEYVKAIAANRMDKVMEALLHIENALDLDPALREVAQVDGDVIDLLE